MAEKAQESQCPEWKYKEVEGMHFSSQKHRITMHSHFSLQYQEWHLHNNSLYSSLQSQNAICLPGKPCRCTKVQQFYKGIGSCSPTSAILQTCAAKITAKSG